MRVVVEASKLAQALSAAMRFLPRRVIYPVLSNVRLEAGEDGALRVRVTDLETEATLAVPASAVEEPGVMLPPVEVLAGLVPKLEGEVKLAGNGDRGTIEWEGGKVSLPLANAEEWPAGIKVEEGRLVPVDVAAVARYVVPFVLWDDCQPVFAGVYLGAAGGELVAVATDTHRMGVWRQKWDGEADAIIPVRAWREAARLGCNEVWVGKDAVRFVGETAVIVSRLIGGKFPNWRTVMPKVYGVGVWFDARLVLAVERAVAVAKVSASKEAAGVVRLEIGGGAVRVGVSGEGGEFEEEVRAEVVRAEVVGGEAVVHFNGSYLLEVLRLVGKGMMDFSVDSAAVVIAAEELPGYQHLLLPIVVKK